MNVLNQYVTDKWAWYNADSVELWGSLPTDSIHYLIYSPPFDSLYTYTNSTRDMGNSRKGEFADHIKFLAAELFRTLKPGRLMSFHCMNLPYSKERDGFIGIRDFRGELIRMFEEYGFIFHSEVCIWKDPVTAMQRTKAIGLLHKQLVKDSAMSRHGIPDYFVTMRKPGANEEPIAGKLAGYIGDDHTMDHYAADYEAIRMPQQHSVMSATDTRQSIDIWQRYASPVWMDIRQSRTLSREDAKDDKDGRHICALQLDVIERGIQLWTNPGDIVATPFGGIASEVYCAVKMGRFGVGCELKERYWDVGKDNIDAAAVEVGQKSLFDETED